MPDATGEDEVTEAEATVPSAETESETHTADTTTDDAPTDDPAAQPEPVPTLRPISTAGQISDPADEIDEYMEEGLFISHFDTDDIDAWQGYSQDTEVTLSSSETPPEGYINSANWHAKQTDKWVQPTVGFVLVQDDTIFGDGAGRWSDTLDSTRVVISDIPHDWSDYTFLTFWAYSAEANDAGIEIVAYSELDSTSTDDYFKKEVIIDWEGWRLFEIPLHEFRANREPVGWEKVDYIKIASSGWSHTPVESTDLIFDEMKLSNVRIGPKLAIDLPSGRPHPNLFLNEAEIAAIQTKIEEEPWAQAAFGALKARADAMLTEEISVPETGGGFYHDDDDAAYAITEEHYRLADRARDLALMYQFTGDAAYQEKAKEILLAYADTYLTYDIQDKDGRIGDEASAGGRATSQGINEARWAIPLAWAYDLIFNELSDAEKAAVEDELLRPVADLLILNNEGRHNHQTWYNSGVGVIGFVLDDKEYVWYALLKDDSSLGYQLDKSVTGDGMWYEGSMHYQFYVLRALLPLMEATHHAGFNIYENPQYKAMFDFMVTYADENLEMPTINDGRVVNLTDSDRATYYEVAYARFGDPTYVPILAQSDRTDLNALLYGSELGDAQSPDWVTQLYDTSDLYVLRSGADDNPLQVTFNGMAYQGGHSHADQLGMVLYGLGRELAPDAGSIKYRLPEQEAWFKLTLAHNALVVDGVSQERAAASTLNDFIALDELQLASLSNPDLYPGVALTRTLLLNDNYLIDLTDAVSDGTHTYDWVYHNVGDFSAEGLSFAPTDEPPGDANGYEYLANVASAESDGDWQAQWDVGPEGTVLVEMLGEPDTQYFSADGLIAARVGDEIAPETVPLLIARREADSTQFASIIQAVADGEEGATISAVETSSDLGRVYQIDHSDGTDYLVLGNEPRELTVDGVDLVASWAWFSQQDDTLTSLLITGSSAAGDGWRVSQEDLGLNKTPPGMGLYLEQTESGRLFVQNIHDFATDITIEGFMDAAAEIIEYDLHGNQTRTMLTKTNGDGVVEFLAHPDVTYEIVAE